VRNLESVQRTADEQLKSLEAKAAEAEAIQ
jgi:hypothetical protein